MINKKDEEIIITFAKKFDVKEIYLFGSSLDQEHEAKDIDLAVRGIAPDLFFDFYGKLLRRLSKPLDIINLSNPSRLTKFIEAQAVKIHG